MTMKNSGNNKHFPAAVKALLLSNATNDSHPASCTSRVSPQMQQNKCNFVSNIERPGVLHARMQRKRIDIVYVAHFYRCVSCCIPAHILLNHTKDINVLLPGVFMCPVMTASPVTGCSQVVLFASSLLGEKKGER